MLEMDNLFMPLEKVKRCEGRLLKTGILKHVMQEQRRTFNTKDLRGRRLDLEQKSSFMDGHYLWL